MPGTVMRRVPDAHGVVQQDDLALAAIGNMGIFDADLVCLLFIDRGTMDLSAREEVNDGPSRLPDYLFVQVSLERLC